MGKNFVVKLMCSICLFVFPVLIVQANDAMNNHTNITKEIRIINSELNKHFYEYIKLIHPVKGTEQAPTPEFKALKFSDIKDALENLKGRIQNLKAEDIHSVSSKLYYLEDRINTELRLLQVEKGIKLPGKNKHKEPEDKNQYQLTFIPPPNDNCTDAIAIGTGTFTGDTTEATVDGSTTCSNYLPSPDVWYEYAAATNSTIIVNTFNSMYDTLLSIHTDCPGNNYNQIVCNDDCSGIQSCLSFEAVAGHSYLIRVSGYSGDYGIYTLNVGTAGYISGAVTDSISGSPIINIHVILYDSNGYWVKEAYPDASGNYSTGGLQPGIYFARTSSDLMYMDELYDDMFCEPYCDPENGTPITVLAGQTTTGINFALEQGGRIAGAITDANTGFPIHEIDVDIFNDNGDFVTYAFSDGTGYYITTDPLVTGTYFALTADYENYIDELYDDMICEPDCDPITGTPISVTVGQTTSGIDFALERGGRITGAVTDAVTGLPIEDVRVEIHDIEGNYMGSVESDGTGNYSTNRALLTGDYFALTRDDESYIDELYDDILCEPDCDPTTGTPISVTIGQTTSGIDFALGRGGRISGTITDAVTGLPVDNVRVEIYDMYGENKGSSYSDYSGNYIIHEPLITGIYFARAESYGIYFDELYDDMLCEPYCDPITGTPISVTMGQTTSGIDFTLERGGRITGTVTDAVTGLPVEDFRVVIYDTNGDSIDYVYSQDTGNYITNNALLTGVYFVLTDNYGIYVDEVYDNHLCEPDCDPTTGTPVFVTIGQTMSGIDFELERGGSISGSITDAITGLPLEGDEVEIYDMNGNYVTDAHTEYTGNYATTAALITGTYYARTDHYGTYVDELYDNLLCEPDCDPTTGTPISVTIGQTTSGIDFALEHGGGISGIVTDAATGLPVSGISVTIYDTNGDYVDYCYTNSEGNYLSDKPLSTGIYFARTQAYEIYLDELYNNILCEPDCDPTAGTPISVTIGQTTPGINFALDQGGIISGTITDSVTGLPVSGIQIKIYDVNGNFIDSAYLNKSGHYITDEPLLTGNYFVLTDNNYDLYLDELYNDHLCEPDCDPTTGTPVSVIIGQTTAGINFVLDQGGRISGTVTDAVTGLPSFSNVVIYDMNGNLLTWTGTDNTGYYITSKALLTGTYYALTHSWSNYVDELYDDIVCEPDCAATTGTPISVTVQQTTAGIDFALDHGGTISGTVTDALTGAGIYSKVEIYDSNGNNVVDAWSNYNGYYITYEPLLTGTYFAKTSNWNCYLDELYNNIPCEYGCDPTTGIPITVITGENTSNINFALEKAIVLTSSKPEVDDEASSTHNGIIELDEAVELIGTLENSCSHTASSVTGTLTSSDPIVINNSDALYPDIGSYSSKKCTTCYSITAPSANKPSTSNHWDITVRETPACTGCLPAYYDFTYHVGNSFVDVLPGSLFYPYIETLLHSEITSGCQFNSYCPSNPVQRQHMAKFICNSMNAVEPNTCVIDGCTHIFEDVHNDNPFCSYIESLYNAGIVAGCQTTPLLYCPNNVVQRQSMAKLICLAMEAMDPGSCNAASCIGIFTDVPSTNIFCSYIESLFYAGVVSGCQSSPRLYCPNANVSRAQMAKFLVNAFGL